MSNTITEERITKEKPVKIGPKRPRLLQSYKKIPKEKTIVESDKETEGTVEEEEDKEDDELLDLNFSGCTSEELLNKRTKSFTCFAQLVLSSSSLLRNINYAFPILKDPGIDDAFNYVEPVPVYDDIGVQKYINICKEFNIVPLRRVKNTLSSKRMNLKFYGLREKQLQAIMDTLTGNHYVETLVLQDNFLTTKMVGFVCKMIEENGTIRVLNMQKCNIGADGAVLLNESLSNSQFLTELDLSCNNLGDTGIRNIQQGLCDMPSLKALNLSNNKLTGESADAIEKIIVNNKVLSELNLSWNEFYTAIGNRLIFRSLRNTDRLRVLNLSWNGITASNAVSWLCRYIRRSSVLEELDLSWNNFSERASNLIKRAVNRSKSLVTVKIGNI
ncbi:uncharacterized protein [Diabrotica undecimpunctata]|uniref:uncharacterized protein n=1 Tax=Diabrotica undecimpunctata TaxID=50387 RepID=UPI003B635F5C